MHLRIEIADKVMFILTGVLMGMYDVRQTLSEVCDDSNAPRGFAILGLTSKSSCC